jgi:prepilin-type N-terminal cleavage/methylation domain-containing protein/prepilin-type processing-associated H-X9-DG protein
MKRAGFTLIELLVVIAIIALLAALLFPVFSSVRRHSRATACATRIKNLTTDLLTYEAQRAAFPYGFAGLRKEPPPGGYAGNPVIDRMGWWWFDLAGIVDDGNTDRIRCPSKRLEDGKLARDVLCGNYGINRSLCKSVSDVEPYDDEFTGMPLCSTDIPRPGETALLMDSGYSLICWWHAAEEPPATFGRSIQDTAYVPGLEINKDRELWPGQTRDAVAGRHPNKTVNIGFLDGHVARKKAIDLVVRKLGEGNYDYSPLWGPK